MNSRAKGAGGERELAHVLNRGLLPQGYKAERGARSGVDGGEDVIVRSPGGSIVPIRIECKRNERIDLGTEALDDAIGQAVRDAGPGGVWVLFWRRNRRPWVMTTVLAPEVIATLHHPDYIRRVLGEKLTEAMVILAK